MLLLLLTIVSKTYFFKMSDVILIFIFKKLPLCLSLTEYLFEYGMLSLFAMFCYSYFSESPK
jgi:hypothetical protein